MNDPIIIARHIVSLATVAGITPTPMSIQKWLYYAQGWNLGLFGERLFDAELEAWRHGPVLRSVFETFRSMDSAAIVATAQPAKSLPTRDAELIAWVMHVYGRIQPAVLSGMTHREAPWLQTREGLPANLGSNRVISTRLMADFFSAERSLYVDEYGIDPQMIILSLTDLREGRVGSMEALRNRPGPEAA